MFSIHMELSAERHVSTQPPVNPLNYILQAWRWRCNIATQMLHQGEEVMERVMETNTERRWRRL